MNTWWEIYDAMPKEDFNRLCGPEEHSLVIGAQQLSNMGVQEEADILGGMALAFRAIRTEPVQCPTGDWTKVTARASAPKES